MVILRLQVNPTLGVRADIAGTRLRGVRGQRLTDARRARGVFAGQPTGRTVRLPLPAGADSFPLMASPAFDFSHLSPEERIQLAEDLWDSLPEREVVLSDAQRAELMRRRALAEADPTRGRPWREVLDEIEQRAQ
ncbi:MAG: addiction module protein [Gemmatimonadaceae bacterium]